VSWRRGNLLTWAQTNALWLIARPGRYLQIKEGKWSITPTPHPPHRRLKPTLLHRDLVKVLMEERAVKVTAHQDRRWFTLSDHGRLCQGANRWL